MIFLDIDGPLTNFDKAITKLQKDPNIDSNNKLWRKIDSLGSKFWSSLDPQPWAESFYNELLRIDEVCFLSSPSLHPSSLKGKLVWLQKFTKQNNMRNYIFTARKELLACNDQSILIDDSDEKVEAFSKASGIGILFPMPYNSGKKHSSEPVLHVKNLLAQIYPNRVKFDYEG